MGNCEEPRLLKTLIALLKEHRAGSVAFVCSGSRKSGLGHLYRVSFIASDLRERGIMTFFEGGIGKAAMIVIDLPNNAGIERVFSLLSRSQIKVLFDNSGDFEGIVDVLVYPDFLPLQHVKAKARYILSGWDYVYPPKAIRFLKGLPPFGNDILITFGGADPGGYTKKAVEILKRKAGLFNVNFHVVFGPLNSDYELFKGVSLPKNLHLYASQRDLSPLYKTSSIVVSSGGLSFAYGVFLERIVIGVPQNENEARRINYYSSLYNFVKFASSPEKAIEEVESALESGRFG